MDKSKLAQRLMATFLEELHDHVTNMNRSLLALEKEADDEEREELLKLLFRSAHSLKGASRAVNVDCMEVACHKMEDIFGEVREGRRELTASLASLILRTVDTIEEAGLRLRSEQDLADAPIHALLPELERAAAGETISERNEPVDTRPKIPQPGASVPGAVEDKSETAHQQGATAAAQADEVSPSRPGKLSTTIRVPAEKLDALLAQSGELLVARRRVATRISDAAELGDAAAQLRNEWCEIERPIQRLCESYEPMESSVNEAPALPRRTATALERTGRQIRELAKGLEQLAANMTSDSRLLTQTCDELDDEVYRVRMLPFAEACGGLERAVRDLARATGKSVELVIEGEDVEVDRSVLEGLKDPLLHLVRNAVDHGVEFPDTRVAGGKLAMGRVTVAAALRGGHVEVTVADDGQGLDLERVREKAARLGLSVPDDDRETARLVFAPGFSTAPIVTDVSGRGVGLDVVQSQIESLHGSADISFEPGVGTRFVLTVPLTLTTIRCLIAETGGQVFAIPTASVRQLVRFEASRVDHVSGGRVLLLGGTPTPLASLAVALGQDEQAQPPGGEKQLAVILVAGKQQVAVVVNAVIAEQEVLVKNLGARIRRVRSISGATLLPSGKIALVLNIPNIVRKALGLTRGGFESRPEHQLESAGPKRLLVVDDSMTTRTLMKSILETAGFDVTPAVDGRSAWELLQAKEFDLVVSDVDMPNMDGFQLTATIRRSSRIAETPVVLVTARGSDEDKARGIEVGANGYLVKSSFDQGNLLEVVDQLL